MAYKFRIPYFINICVCLLLIFQSLPIKLFGQSNTIKFNRIPRDQGLSQTTVLCAKKDSRGFMWFGTQDGLNRYDGYKFTVFKKNPAEFNSLSENWIWTIYEDSSDVLWVGTFGGGLNRFDRKTEIFVSYRNNPENPSSLSNDTVWSLYEYPRGTLWVGANDGLNKMDMRTGLFTYFKPADDNTNTFAIESFEPGTLWLLTAGGLAEFNVNTNQFIHYPHDSNKPDELGQVYRVMAKGNSGILWVSTTNTGVNRFDTHSKKVIRIQHDPAHPQTSLPSNNIKSLFEDSHGMLWVGTREGLSLKVQNNTSFTFTTLKHNPLDPTSISHSYIFSIYESNTGEIWIGTRDGLNRFDSHNQKFVHHRATPNLSKENSDGSTVKLALKSLSHNNVLPILQSSQRPNTLWVGTTDGLNEINKLTGKIQHIKQNALNINSGPATNYILSLLEDRSGNLWIGTRGGGLSKMSHDPGGNAFFEHYSFDPENESSISADNVHTIFQDLSGTIWVGTGCGGLIEHLPASNSFLRTQWLPADSKAVLDPFIYTILEDNSGFFWIGTASGGVYLMDRKTKLFKQYNNDPINPNSLSSNRVLSIYQSSITHDIWIGTALGLNRLVKPVRPEDDYTFKQFHESDGLPNEVIYGILEDESGHLWVSTNKGLARILPDTNQLKVRIYTTADGLQGDEFNQNAFHKNNNGELFFGGVNGYNVFHPDSVADNPNIPPIVITDFKILNESVPINNTSNTILNQHISEVNNIQLSYKHKVISFEFSALNFIIPQQNQYAYKMDGFDEDWNFSGSRRFATYTNLDPGDYIFRVKGSNNDNIWNEDGASVKIHITPPPWKTWWAYIFYVATFMACVFGFIRYQIHSKAKEIQIKADIEHARIEERELVRKKSSADFHDEAGNMLTKIALFTELAKRSEISSSTEEYLNKIEENTKSLSGRMRDFIWVLDPGKDNLYDLLTRLKEFGNSMFDPGGIRFQTKGVDESLNNVNVPLQDRRSILLLFKEAMNNCLKHSKSTEVFLEVSFQQNKLIIALIDNGIGFDQENVRGGYGLQNMNSRAKKIGGVLEINSDKSGTTIRFAKKIELEANN